MSFISAAVLKGTQDDKLGLEVIKSNDGVTQIHQLGLFADDNPQLEEGMPIYSINNVPCNDKSLSEIENMIDSSMGIITIIAGGDEETNNQTNEQELPQNGDMLKIISLAALGWTPNLQKHIQERSRLWKAVLFSLFLVDLTDAIFDIILSGRAIFYGSEEKGGLALLLIFATLSGRFLSGLYGRALAKSCTQDASLASFAFMEMAVFFLEDGASILFLTKNTDELDFIEGGSILFTVICFICYIGYFVIDCNKFMSRNKMGGPLMLMFFLSAVFQIYILFSQVIGNPSETIPAMLGVLDLAVYMFTAIGVIGVTIPLFIVSGRRRTLLMN